MIDLEASRAGLLAEIGARDAALAALDGPFDPRFWSPDPVRVAARGSRRGLFRALELALSARFAAAPRRTRVSDLLAPLRSALGNAHKHGHRGDRGRAIEVEVVATRRGALIAVHDGGEGFDVALAVRRLRSGERYFRGAGSGLRGFDRARSTIAFEAGGRVALIRFLAPSRGPSAQEREIAHALAGGRGAGPALAVVEPAARGGPTRLRCLLGESGAAEPRILCGALFPARAQADADRAAMARLRERLADAPLRAPEPLAPLRQLPELALYDFDPWLELDDYLAQRGDAAVAGIARRVAATLDALRTDGERRAHRAAAGPDPGRCRVRYGVDGRFYLDGCGAGAARIAPCLERLSRRLRDRARAIPTSIDADSAAVRS